MHKVSYVLANRFSQNTLETYIFKQHPSGKDKLSLCDFDYPNIFRNRKVFKSIATGKAGYENLESDRTSSMSEKIQTAILAIFKSFKQPLYRYLAIKPTQQVS